MKTYVHLYVAEFFLEWEMFQTEVVEEMKTHFMFSNIFPNIVPLMIMWKNVVEPDRPWIWCRKDAIYMADN
jgi:hypothetical protein